ncbi:MAG: 50S ribosomal protein L4 [Chloroflexi bacterium]|nr:50S ribosomal protein L4 [Chloroflexota bacterium]
MELPVRNFEGDIVGSVELSDRVWAAPMNSAVLHQVVVAQLANRRQGTHDTKTRGDSTYSTAKLGNQKGGGRARRGSRSSHLMGNSVAHGPHPRSYRQRLPAKVRRLALQVALSDKVREERLFILDSLRFDEPKTKRMKQLLSNLGVEGSTLVVVEGGNDALLKSMNNLRNVAAATLQLLNVTETAGVRNMVITEDGARHIDETVGATVRKPAKGEKRK